MRHRSSLRAIRPRAEALSRCCLGLVAIAALATACNPFVHKAAPQYPKDPRFSEFVFRSDEEPTVKDRMDSVNVRWPNLEASEVHVVVEYSPALAFIPAQDPESHLWGHIDSSGKWVIEPVYRNVRYFSPIGLAAVQQAV